MQHCEYDPLTLPKVGNVSVRELISEVFLFFYSTLGHWQALVSGGVVTALIVILERVSGYRLNRKTFVGLFVGVFLLVAFFLAWREERIGRLRQEAEINRMLAVKPRLKGKIEFFRMGNTTTSPDHLSVAMVMSIGNVGSVPTVADTWNCYLNLHGRNGMEAVRGEFRGFPEGLELTRGTNKPMVFERDDALYIKTMRTPIGPGAKVVGAMICRFPNAGIANLKSSENNTLLVTFRDVIGEQHHVELRYLNHPGMDYSDRIDRGEWVDIPGMDQPAAGPSPKK